MRKWSDLLEANKEDLAAICTLELGKPYTESFVTVKYATDFLDWFEGEIERTYDETIPAARGDELDLHSQRASGRCGSHYALELTHRDGDEEDWSRYRDREHGGIEACT